MERQAGPVRPAPPDAKELAGQRRNGRQGVQNRQPDRDIARIARSLGFSQEEIFEIERLYLSGPNGFLK